MTKRISNPPPPVKDKPPYVGNTPVQLGQIEAADAMMIDGKIVTREDYRELQAQFDQLQTELFNCRKKSASQAVQIETLAKEVDSANDRAGAIADERDALAANMAEHQRLHGELNAILHPDGNGPAAPSLCDLVSYVRSDRQALAAQVEALRDAGNEVYAELQQWALSESHEETNRVFKLWLATRAATPQHHLLEVQAKAAYSGYVAGWSFQQKPLEPAATQYAESIRQGGAL